MQQRFGADKLAVALIDVDPAYYEKPEEYLPQAKKIMDRLPNGSSMKICLCRPAVLCFALGVIKDRFLTLNPRAIRPSMTRRIP